MAITSWLLGYRHVGDQAYSIDGGADSGFDGSEYSLLQLMQLLEIDLDGAGLAASVYLGRDRLIRITGNATFTLAWTTTELPELLGFTGDLSGASSYVAAYPSGLLFSPGYPATRPVADGEPGYSVEDVRIEIDRSGTLVNTTYNHSQTWDELTWSGVVRSRVTAADITAVSAGGTWRRFRRLVLVPNHPWQHYELVDEDGTAAAASLASYLGTYKCRELPSDVQDRRIANSNNRWSFGLKAIRIAD